MKYSLCFIAIALLGTSAFAQDPLEDKGEVLFSKKNYIEALDVYKQLFKQEPDNVEYNYRLAFCYLNTFTNRADAVSHLEYISQKRSKDAEIWYYLGLAYQYGNRFNDAIAAYEKAKVLGAGKLLAGIERQIETCNNGKELVKYPLNVTFENLGGPVNTPYTDYLPLIAPSESFMVFTSRRKENTGSLQEVDGYYSSDIYISYPKNGKWGDVKALPSTINTAYDEKAVDISGDGKKMIVYVDRIDSLGNIYYSENAKMGFQKITKFPGDINSGFESSGTISKEEDLILFASDREGGLGGTDIYAVRKLPNGKWGVPENLGAQINTKYNEDFPHLSNDGKTFYFTSQGHSSMGGYDIFKCMWNPYTNTWGAPQNMGYPINNSYDNMNISFANDGSQAYLSTVRDDGMGDLDIYKVKFNGSNERYCIVTGNVITHDTLMDPNKRITMMASRMDSREVFRYQPIKKSGRYVMALQPGNYNIKVSAEGLQDVSYALTIHDVPFQSEINQNFVFDASASKK